MHSCRATAVKAAKAAGKILLKYFRKTKNIREKSGRRGLVSIADEASERAIIGIIKNKFPGHSIIAEESGIDHQHSRFTWHIDPLDGTTNYIFGLRDWGTEIGLAEPLRFNLLKKIVKNTYKIRMTGDAVTSMRRVAEGAADGLLFLRLNDWDVAAGSLIIREAGGKVTTLSGKEWELGDKEFAASNGKVHSGLLRLIGRRQ
ncbi:hypothetical protein HYU13_06630 [Candidatus Woesearchaeota archaeon]|nr:hypothetical protein [Candidatus Woesearchaeota archaeon]